MQIHHEDLIESSALLLWGSNWDHIGDVSSEK